ncbi:hypothetical protein [Streptomyces sp. NPDC014995]|uniref:hypothetical protein n=1 Tax=Streptomyces sp. NPDC014995 TaxID=3364936 RepID=UPI0036F71402
MSETNAVSGQEAPTSVAEASASVVEVSDRASGRVASVVRRRAARAASAGLGGRSAGCPCADSREGCSPCCSRAARSARRAASAGLASFSPITPPSAA